MNISYNFHISILGFVEKSDVKDKILKLSAEYWNYKGFYKFPTEFDGSLI